MEVSLLAQESPQFDRSDDRIDERQNDVEVAYHHGDDGESSDACNHETSLVGNECHEHSVLSALVVADRVQVERISRVFPYTVEDIAGRHGFGERAAGVVWKRPCVAVLTGDNPAPSGANGCIIHADRQVGGVVWIIPHDHEVFIILVTNKYAIHPWCNSRG